MTGDLQLDKLDLNEIEFLCGIQGRLHHHIITPQIFSLRREIPEDFVVNEVLPDRTVLDSNSAFLLGPHEPGLFSHHILWKRGVDTQKAIGLVSRHLKIPADWIGYAGLKDARAITRQRVSIWSPNSQIYPSVDLGNISLFEGVKKRHNINLGDLFGNNFSIILKKSGLVDFGDETRLPIIEACGLAGFPNFFGVQRFSSARPVSHIVGKFLLREDWKGAVMAYLAISSKNEPQEVQKIRKELSESEDFKKFLINMPKNYFLEREIAKIVTFSRNFQRAIFSINDGTLKLFVSAYQSFVYNWLLSKYLIRKQKDPTENIHDLPLIGWKMSLEEFQSWVGEEIRIILKRDGISLESFNQRQTPIRVQGRKRLAIEYPENMSVRATDSGSLLKFVLPRGTYATSLIREITASCTIQFQGLQSISDYSEYLNLAERILEFPVGISSSSENV